MENEIWKPVVGYDELAGIAEVSNLGRVRTLDRRAPSRRAFQPTQLKRGRLLSPWVAQNGYPHVAIKLGDKRTKYLVHRLVALAFVEGHFEGATVDHVDGNKRNNVASNLQWVTLGRNTALQWKTGLVNLRGERHPSAKLTNADVKQIRASSDSHAAAARRFGVSDSLIGMIRSGKKRIAL